MPNITKAHIENNKDGMVNLCTRCFYDSAIYTDSSNFCHICGSEETVIRIPKYSHQSIIEQVESRQKQAVRAVLQKALDSLE